MKFNQRMRYRMNRPIAIFDLDMTLADNTHRLTYKESKDYKTFYDNDLVFEDAPIIKNVSFLKRLMAAGIKPVFITGRNINCEAGTKDWIRQYLEVEVNANPLTLWMRNSRDWRPAEIIKSEAFTLLELSKEFGTFVGAFDDSLVCRNMYARFGLPAFHLE